MSTLVGVALLAAGLTAGGRAIAGGGASCIPPDAIFAADAAGTKVRMTVGYERNPAPELDNIGTEYRGVNALGDPIGGGSACGDPNRWETLTLYVGDGRDSIRMDGRKPEVLSGDPMARFVVVTAHGGSGADRLRGHGGRDTIYGEGGSDVIRVAGGRADVADCGPGNDTAYLSGADHAVGCEHKN